MCQQYDIITIYLPGRQFATGVVNTDGKFDASIVDTGVNLLPVSTTPAVLVAKFSAIVVDTSGAP